MADTTTPENDTTGGSLIDAGYDATTGDDTGTGDGDTTTTDGATGTDDLEARVIAAIEARFDSVLDKRVNQTIKAIERRYAKADDGDGKTTPKPDATPAGPSADAIRAARIAAREYLGDHLRFVAPEERELANDLVHAAVLTAAHANGIDDEDRVGRDVAKRVAGNIVALRKQYEALTVAGLKRRNALVEQPGQNPGQATGTANPDSEWNKGAEIAKRLRPVPQPAAQAS